ncbi:MAG: acyloxyacyl hydrolase [Rhabdaerophilum sp.]
MVPPSPARLLACCAALAASLSHALADENLQSRLELRLGITAHDPIGPEKGGADIAGDVLVSLVKASHWAIPRLAIGGTLSLAGRTNVAHGGLNWQFPLSENVFLEGGAGLALHDGAVGRESARRQSAMGCRFAFRETVGLGYRLGSGWSVIGSIEHLSNAGLCTRNRGLTHAGLRMGYAF